LPLGGEKGGRVSQVHRPRGGAQAIGELGRMKEEGTSVGVSEVKLSKGTYFLEKVLRTKEVGEASTEILRSKRGDLGKDQPD